MADTHDWAIAHGPDHDKPEGHREDREIDVRAIFSFAAGLLVSAIVINGMIWLLFQFFSGREAVRSAPEYPLAAGQETRVPPEPRLQTNPRADLRELRAHEAAVLGTYGWVDRAAGVVRIPIEEAMKLTVQRGLPVRPASGEAPK